MQPLKPAEKRAVLENRPQAQPGDIEEYERLLAMRFTEDPDSQPAAAPEEDSQKTSRIDREKRIKELHRKLFGSLAVQQSSR
jgi:hypothetical protein